MRNLKLTPAGVIRWMAALVTLALAAALCLSCLDLYRAGNAPENLTAEGVRIHDMYTRENVGVKLQELAAPAVCWGILLVLSALQPREPEKRLPIDPENALRLLAPRVFPTAAMEKLRARREVVGRICFIILSLCGAWLFYYFTCRSLFTSWDLEFVMGLMVKSTWAASLIAVAVMCLWAWWEGRSCAAEWAEAKKAPRRPEPAKKPVRKEFPVNIPRAILLIAALALIAAGVLNGGMYDVLVKAINICTECIGLG